MYYIYHIPNHKWKDSSIGKIGCTDELIIRMRKQGATEYQILETHLDIYIASDREIELQKQYGYPVDKIPYWRTVKMSSKGGKIGGVVSIKNGHLKKIREARQRPIIQFDKSGNKIREWDSGAECAKELNLHSGNITAVCKGKLKSHKGFVFRYKEQTYC